MKFIKLLTDEQQHIWNQYSDFDTIFKEVGAPFPPKEHLEHIDQNHGEKIIAVSNDEKTILGWIGIIPNEKESYAELAGIEVHSQFRSEGIGKRLISRAQDWLSDMGIREFRFSTSPLFAANTSLYLKNFSTEYKWNNGASIPPENIPWPVVDCVMKWTEKSSRIKVNHNKGLEHLSLLQWDNLKPTLNKTSLEEESEYKIAGLPFLSLPVVLSELKLGNKAVLMITFDMFEILDNRGYKIKTMIKEDSMFYYIFDKKD